jgi:hypothetical protein
MRHKWHVSLAVTLMPSPSSDVVSHKPLHVAIAHRQLGIVSRGNVVTQHGPVIVAADQ